MSYSGVYPTYPMSAPLSYWPTPSRTNFQPALYRPRPQNFFPQSSFKRPQPQVTDWRQAYLPQNRIPQRYYPGVQSMVSDTYNGLGVNHYRAEQHKEKGNEYREVQLPYMAITEYQKALAEDPAYTDAYYNLGRTYIVVGQPENAVMAFEGLLQVAPDDHEARISLAEQLTLLGRLDDARGHYEFILARNPRYDSASRNLKYLDVMAQSAQSPFMAQFQLIGRGLENVKQAKELLRPYYLQRGDASKLQLMERLQYDFSPTQRIKQIPNLAEYDHFKNTIRFAPELAFASPNVLAAYMAHELTHASDGDATSSVLEEQDAYREQARVWKITKGAITEPNLDLATNYYEQSPDRLDQAVRSIYQIRDPLISEKSPGHGVVYPTMPALQQAYIRSETLEKNFKYTDWIYRQLKSLLPSYGII